MRQDKNTSCQKYLESFMNTVEVIEHSGGQIGNDVGLINNAPNKTGIYAKTYARDQYLPCVFLMGADRNRYGKLLENMENDYTQKQDRYPKTVNDAYSLMLNWKQDPQNMM